MSALSTITQLAAIGDQETSDANGDPSTAKVTANRELVVTQENSEYETVAASQTAQVLGSTGAAGDFLAGIVIVPASVSPGVVTILDNATSINLFPGGTDSLLELKPIFVPLNIVSVSGAWKVTTGANVSVIAIGRFT